MKSSAERSGTQTGLVLSDAESVTSTAVPPLAGATAIALGARLPLVWNRGLPCTKAIQRPSDDQAGECGSRACAIAVRPPSSTRWTKIVSRSL